MSLVDGLSGPFHSAVDLATHEMKAGERHGGAVRTGGTPGQQRLRLFGFSRTLQQAGQQAEIRGVRRENGEGRFGARAGIGGAAGERMMPA